MQTELGISTEHWGWVLSAFIFACGAFEVPMGAWGDRYGHRGVLSRIVAWWSVFACLTGFVSSFPALLAVRFLFGAGEAGAYPNIAGVVGRWFPVSQRARMQGLVWASGRIGSGITPLVVVPIMQAWGWRAAFWIIGSLGFFRVAAWWTWYRNSPAEDPRASDEERTEAAAPIHASHAIPWRLLAASKQLWLITAMYSLYVWGSYFYFSWLPVYLLRARDFTETEMGQLGALPFFMGACGNLCGGALSDALVRRCGLRNGRRFVGSASLALTAIIFLLVANTHGKWQVIGLLSFGLLVLDFLVPTAWATCLDVGQEHSGAVSGVMSTAGQFGGLACTLVFGYIAGRTGSFDAPLYIISGMVLLSAILFWFVNAGSPIGRQTGTLTASR
jgi:MFS family permease